MSSVRSGGEDGFGSNFLDVTSKTQATKEKIDYVKMENSHASKDAINRVQGQPVGWEKSFANHTHDKESASGIGDELLQLSSNNTTRLKHARRT